MLQIVAYPDERLRLRSEPIETVDDDLRRFIDDMFETMYEAKGVGLAAIQVGRPIRLFVTHAPNDQRLVFMNPQFIETSIEEETAEEGCLSILGVNADVSRSARVRVQAVNRRGRPFNLQADEMLARVIQHETDHLNGVLFIDHLTEEERVRLLGDYPPR